MMSQAAAAANQKFLVVDDHEAVLEGTVPALKQEYPTAEGWGLATMAVSKGMN